MKGGVVEGSLQRDFSDARELCYVISTPLSRIQRVEVNNPKPCRLVRFRKAKGTLSLGEMRFYDRAGRQIKGKSIACSVLSSDPGVGKAFDGDPLTYFSVTGLFDSWIGLQFDRPEVVAAIEFCPRTDDNDISPGDTYRLFYWSSSGTDGQWMSLGQQTAISYELVYENVPSGALLWLRDLTRGREERPFTYENGKQIWW